MYCIVVNSSEMESFKYLLKYVATIKSTAITDQHQLENVNRFVRLAVSMESVYNYSEIVELPAVQSAVDLELVKIMATKHWKDFTAFYKENSNNLSWLQYEQCLYKMKILTIASTACQELGKTIKYSKIASIVDSSADQVEMILMDCVRAGVLECKMDQHLQQVLITYVSVCLLVNV